MMTTETTMAYDRGRAAAIEECLDHGRHKFGDHLGYMEQEAEDLASNTFDSLDLPDDDRAEFVAGFQGGVTEAIHRAEKAVRDLASAIKMAAAVSERGDLLYVDLLVDAKADVERGVDLSEVVERVLDEHPDLDPVRRANLHDELMYELAAQ